MRPLSFAETSRRVPAVPTARTQLGEMVGAYMIMIPLDNSFIASWDARSVPYFREVH